MSRVSLLRLTVTALVSLLVGTGCWEQWSDTWWPQMKRQKEHARMVRELEKGDECVTNGGLLGRITEVGDSFIKVEIAKGTEVKVQKQAVSQIVPKGTVNAA